MAKRSESIITEIFEDISGASKLKWTQSTFGGMLGVTLNTRAHYQL